MVRINLQNGKRTKRLKAFGSMGFPSRTRFTPQEGLNEPALKEGFSLPWISSQGLRFNDRLILEGCHYIEVVLLFLLLAFVFLVKNKQGWDLIIQSVLIVILLAGFYRTILFEKLNKNLRTIIDKLGGRFVPGNSILSAPPQARFDYDSQDCYVMSLIDQNFRLVLEYSCFFGKECEFRVEKSKEGESRWIVFGQDKDLVRAALEDPKTSKNLNEILKSFNYLSYGKDGMMHVGELFDGRLTEPGIVFDTIERMISLGKLLKLNEEG